MKRASKYLVIFLFGIICISGIILFFDYSAGREQISLPMVIDENRLFISSNFGPVFFDSGAPISLVDADFASKNGFPMLHRVVTIKDLSGTDMESELAIIPKLEIHSNVKGKNWSIFDLEVALVRGLQDRMKTDIIVGMPVFNNQIVKFDFFTQEIKLLENLPFGWNCNELHLTTLNGSVIISLCTDTNASYDAVLDTGHGGFFHFKAAEWDSVPKVAEQEEAKGAAILSDTYSRRARASCILTFGNLSIKNSPISSIANSRWNLIGLSALRNTSFAIDLSQKKIVFVAPSLFANHVDIAVGPPIPFSSR